MQIENLDKLSALVKSAIFIGNWKKKENNESNHTNVVSQKKNFKDNKESWPASGNIQKQSNVYIMIFNLFKNCQSFAQKTS